MAKADDELRVMRRKLKLQQNVSATYRKRIADVVHQYADEVRRGGLSPPRWADRTAAVALERDILRDDASSVASQRRIDHSGAARSATQTARGGWAPSTDASPAPFVLSSPGRAAQGEAMDADRLRKAHHLSVLIAERREAERRAAEARAEVDALKQQVAELQQRWMSLAQDPGTDAYWKAVCEAYTARISSLQSELDAARGDATAGSYNSDSDIEVVVVEGESQRAVQPRRGLSESEQLRRQVVLLRSRLSKIRQDYDELQKASTASRPEPVDTALEHLRAGKRVIADLETRLKAEISAKLEIEGILAQARASLTAKDALVQQLQQELTVMREAWDRREGREGDALVEVRHSLALASAQIAERDAEILALRKASSHEAETAKRHEASSRHLMAVVESLESRLRIALNVQGQRHQERSCSRDLDAALHRAVGQVQNIYETVLPERIDAIRKHVETITTIDTQLRYKDDVLSLAESRVLELEEEVRKLKQHLIQLTPLYEAAPTTVSRLERIIVEVEEWRLEAQRCTMKTCPPDPQRVIGRIDLRMMQLAAQRKHPTPASASGGDVPAVIRTLESITFASPRAEAANDDVLVDPQLLVVPPLPSTPFRRREPPHRLHRDAAAHEAADVFRLLDDRGMGKLGRSQLEVCLRLLAVSTPLPSHIVEWTEKDFVAFILSHLPPP